MVEVQPLPGLRPAVVGPPPDPHGPVAEDQRPGRRAQPAAQGFGLHLLPQGVPTRARGHEAAFGDDGPCAGGRAAGGEPEAGAGLPPVPAFGFPAWPPPRGTLAPGVAFADVPGVQLQDHLVGFAGQCALVRVGGGGLVELGAQALGALALAARFAVEGGAGEWDAGKVGEHGAGLLDGPFAG